MGDFRVAKIGGYFGWWFSKVIYFFSWFMIFRVDGFFKVYLFMLKFKLRFLNGSYSRFDNL